MAGASWARQSVSGKAVGDQLELEHHGTAVFGEEFNLTPRT